MPDGSPGEVDASSNILRLIPGSMSHVHQIIEGGVIVCEDHRAVELLNAKSGPEVFKPETCDNSATDGEQIGLDDRCGQVPLELGLAGHHGVGGFVWQFVLFSDEDGDGCGE